MTRIAQFHDRNICAVNAAADINVLAKIRSGNGEARLTLRLRNVRAIHGFVTTRITAENIHAHRSVRKHLGKTIGDITQSYSDDLHIGSHR